MMKQNSLSDKTTILCLKKAKLINILAIKNLRLETIRTNLNMKELETGSDHNKEPGSFGLLWVEKPHYPGGVEGDITSAVPLSTWHAMKHQDRSTGCIFAHP